MLIEKSIAKGGKRCTITSKYICDMCKKSLKKDERILLSTSEKGKDKVSKKWDLCEKCMKIIEKNVKVWYNKIVNKSL